MKKRIFSSFLCLALFTGLFLPALASEPQVISFSDVPDSAWYYPVVMELAEKGILTGVADGRFAPMSNITYAQFVTMITRQFYEVQYTGAGTAWYSPYMATAETAGILDRIEIDPSDSLTRFDMAQLIYNVILDKGLSITPADSSAIGDWPFIPENYQAAVLACYGASLISGSDSHGSFNGARTLTRAEAAAIMSRLLNKAELTPDTEEEPEPTTYDDSNACELGKQYTTDSGYGVTVNSAKAHKVKGVNTFSFKYTLKNMTSDKYLYEDTFTIIFTDGTSSNQGGIYLDGMYPGDTLTKTFNLILEDKEVAYLLFNDGASFFFTPPKIEDMNTHLVWDIQ